MAAIKIKPFTQIRSGRIDINNYISDAGLDALYVLEGHKDAEKVKNMRNNKVVYDWTGVYGITDSAINEVKLRAKEAGIKLPEEMTKITKAKQLDAKHEKVARMYAGYFAWVNDTKMNQLTDDAFSSYTPHERDVLLSYLHNVDISQLTTGNPGSLIDAIKLHNEDEVIRKIFMKADGSYIDYEKLRKEDKRGLGNRLMATMQWWYNPQADVVQDMKKRDNLYKNDYNEVGRMKNMLAANEFLIEDTKARKNELAGLWETPSALKSMFPRPMQPQETQEQPIAAPKPPQERTFVEKVADSVKAAFGAFTGDSNQVANEPENILNSANGEQQ